MKICLLLVLLTSCTFAQVPASQQKAAEETRAPGPTEDPATSEVNLYECPSDNKRCAIELELPGQHVIMVQWATERYVDQWVSALEAATKRGLTKPVVKGPSR